MNSAWVVQIFDCRYLVGGSDRYDAWLKTRKIIGSNHMHIDMIAEVRSYTGNGRRWEHYKALGLPLLHTLDRDQLRKELSAKQLIHQSRREC